MPRKSQGANLEPAAKAISQVGKRKKPASLSAPRSLPQASSDVAGPSQPAPLAEAPKSKKQKQPKEEKEKRLNRAGGTSTFLKHPNQKVRERIERALGVGAGINHRLYLLEVEPKVAAEAGGPSQKFTVLGATGNVYNVTIDKWPHCTCPDHAKGNVCKHILFIMLRVLRLGNDNPIVWQKALLTSEVEQALSSFDGHARGVMADRRIANKWRKLTHGEEGGEEGGEGGTKRREVEGDCSICFESMEEGGRELLTWCGSCGNNFHRGCVQRWCGSSSLGATCALCRSQWRDGDAPAETDGGSGGYVNLKGGQEPQLDELYGDNAHWLNRRRFHSR